MLRIKRDLATAVRVFFTCRTTWKPPNTIATILGDHRSVVPWGTITEVEQILQHVTLDTVVQLARFGSDLHFRVEDRQVCEGPVADDFPNYEPLLQQDQPYSVIIDRGSLVATCNDHELAIARSIDRLAMKGPLVAGAIRQALQSLDFMVCHEDCRFLACYVHWRRTNPIFQPWAAAIIAQRTRLR